MLNTPARNESLLRWALTMNKETSRGGEDSRFRKPKLETQPELEVGNRPVFKPPQLPFHFPDTFLSKITKHRVPYKVSL